MPANIVKYSLIILLKLIIISCFAQQNINIRLENPHPYRNSTITKEIKSNQNDFDIYFQELNFEIDPSIYYIKGEVRIFYKSLVDLDSLIIDLNNSLQIDSIKKNNTVLLFSHQNNQVDIDIDNLSQNSQDSLTIYYQGAPTKQNHAFFIDVQDSIDLIPVLATLSEPYGASDWWPCKNTLTDKIDSLDINISCPKGNKAISLGLLSKVDTLHSKLIFHWEHRYPVVPYLVAISVSDYETYHSYIHYNNTDSLLFLNYLYKNNLYNKKWNIDRTELFFNLFDSLFVPYPFPKEKYGHVEFPILGGMEHQTISSMGKFDFEIISHELAHQWFGDYLTCGSWEDIWLNEGFATYLTGLCYENMLDGYFWPYWKELTIDKITEDSTGTVFPSDTTNFRTLFDSRLTYRKASYLLHLIRWTIGDKDFFQAINNYLNNSELAYNFTKTPKLIAEFEQQADTSLSQIMNDWFYGEGYPIFDISWSQDSKFNIQINQKSALNNNHFFELYIPIKLLGENDSLNLRINNSFNQQHYSFNVNFEVDTVIFDPQKWLISKYSICKKEVYKSDNINIYPNPFMDIVNIQSSEKIKSISVYNTKGQAIKYIQNKNYINLSNSNSGLYFLYIETTESLTVRKIIKL